MYRCWSEVEDHRLTPHPQPEVAVADLAGFALELAAWGHPDGSGLALPDMPPAAAMISCSIATWRAKAPRLA